MKRRIVLALAFLTVSAAARAATLYVPTQFATIQAAVNAAQSGDVVLVLSGVYSDVTHQSGGGDTTKCAVVMKSNITLRGVGPGMTVIDGQHRGRGIYCSGVTNSTIRELTVRNCFSQTYGAALFCTNGSTPSVLSCDFLNNFDGGIICTQSSSPTITDCRLTSNLGKSGGGLAGDSNCSPAVTNCFITDNSAGMGGGIYFRTNCSPTFTGCLILRNSIDTVGGNGGGIALDSTHGTFNGCWIDANVGSGGGGAIYTTSATYTMTNCYIRGNHTTNSYGPGGGVFADYATDATLIGCTITGNVIEGSDPYSDGGGVADYYANQVTLRQCTLAANASGTGEGGGISIYGNTPTIDKSIIADNNPGAGIFCGDQGPVISCTDVFGNSGGDAICGTDAGHNFRLDPLFCSLSGNDFHLRAGSPCLAGHHPEGGGVCNGSRLGSQDQGCTPVGVTESTPAERTSKLFAIQPNPFRPDTRILFETAQSGFVSLRVFDVSGREVRMLANGPMEAGRHEQRWDGRDGHGAPLPAGIYFARLSTSDGRQTRQLVLTK